MKVKIRDDWHAEKEIIHAELNGNRASYKIGRGQDAWSNLPDELADKIDKNIFEIEISNKKDNKPTKKEKIQPKKVKTKKAKKNIVNRIKSYTDDLLDDGKRNYSNNDKKKSPGRPRKKRKK